jgi:hypothetical protein
MGTGFISTKYSENHQEWLAEYFPVLAGIFISTGVLFDALQYGYFNTL